MFSYNINAKPFETCSGINLNRNVFIYSGAEYAYNIEGFDLPFGFIADNV